ncbi:lipase maturation factor, partial [Toxoplasma gondii GAB2-2007-GAL-DOM2]
MNVSSGYCCARFFSVLIVSIYVTGNYGFFNILSCVVCLALLDDSLLLFKFPSPLENAVSLQENPQRKRRTLRQGQISVLAVLQIKKEGSYGHRDTMSMFPVHIYLCARMHCVSIYIYIYIYIYAKKEVHLEWSCLHTHIY